MHSPSSRVALVTGANKGIGLQIARNLAQAGLTVLLGARRIAAGEAAAASLGTQGFDTRFIELDLERPASIHAAARLIEASVGRLDVLVNNAGITDTSDAAPEQADIDGVRKIFETNFFGTLAVTQAMLPLLRKSDAGRIVNVSSGLGSLALNADPQWEFAHVKLLGYSASKAALNMLTVQLAAGLRGTPIKVNSADPGYTATDLNNHRGNQTIGQGAAEATRLALLDESGPSGGFFSSDGANPW
jgi:NAD(P)-dependent dehydrogenase (short-subunit alcohol dehydrogenase family)